MELRRNILLRCHRLCISRLRLRFRILGNFDDFLIDCDSEDGMGAGGGFVHLRLRSHTLCDTLVKQRDALGF